MIDEKRLIEELRESNLHHASNSREEALLDRTIRIVKEQPKVNEWIPVEERVPEDNQAVLTCKNKQISILIWKVEKRIWLEPKGNWWWSYCMVEKWQPLPEPYEVRENE